MMISTPQGMPGGVPAAGHWPTDSEHGQALAQFLCFALGQERYALRIDAVREILEVARMTPLPLMPSFVRGVMNLRGAVVPVVDLGTRLGLPPTTVGRRTCVVIVDTAPVSASARASANAHAKLVRVLMVVLFALPVPRGRPNRAAIGVRRGGRARHYHAPRSDGRSVAAAGPRRSSDDGGAPAGAATQKALTLLRVSVIARSRT